MAQWNDVVNSGGKKTASGAEITAHLITVHIPVRAYCRIKYLATLCSEDFLICEAGYQEEDQWDPDDIGYRLALCLGSQSGSNRVFFVGDHETYVGHLYFYVWYPITGCTIDWRYGFQTRR